MDKTFVSACRKVLAEFVMTNEEIKKKTSFVEQVNIVNKIINEITDEEVISLVLLERKRGIPPKTKKIIAKSLKLGLYGAAAVLPGGFTVIVLAQYIADMHNYKCEIKCQKGKFEDKRLCYRQCDYQTAKKMVNIIEADLKKCKTTVNPEKCMKKLWKLLSKWKQKLSAAEIRLKTQTKISRMKG